ncbi:brachyurin-like [Neocloeon triangulifer]|uniref:brachyurin-like n=1 Tax=Neocloeon triangulifer TaxID=2078957 RepID=UPI00286F4F91|nr:brachyurin-like [Neocloeon triangulifer]
MGNQPLTVSLILIIGFLLAKVSAGITGQIIGGTKAKQTQFPFQAFIIADTSNYCGGAIISKDWVITTTKCISSFNNFVVLAGGIDRVNAKEKGEQVFTSTTKIVHENYNKDMELNDIGLIKVLFTLDKVYVGALRLPKRSQVGNLFENLNVIAAGFGVTTKTSQTPNRYMMFTSLKTIDNYNCSLKLGSNVFNPSILCTAADSKKGVCTGDVGGPLVWKDTDGIYTAIGIFSYYKFSCISYPEVFTRVTAFLDWISQKTGIPIVE